MSSFGFSNIVTDGLVFYLDASNKKSYSGSGTDVFDVNGYVLINNTATEFLIGTIPQSIGSCNFKGEIGCIKVYNKSITDLEVLKNYNVLKSRFI